MKELIDGLWKIAPRFMSLVVILGVIFYIAYQVASFQQRFENMEVRLIRLEKKVDMIVEYLIKERSDYSRQSGQSRTGK